MDLLNDESNDGGYVSGTFKSTRLVNGHTVEVRSPRVLEFVISHRFGNVNQGSQEFWGLDQSSIRLALEYGLMENLINTEFGVASHQKERRNLKPLGVT